MAKTVHARTIAVQSLDYRYGKIVVPPYEVDIEFTPQEEAALDSGITAGMIPDNASENNKLATQEDVATSSATYRGSYNLVSDLSLTTAATEADVAAALATIVTTADNNDYANVQIPSSDLTPTEIVRTDRYKFDGTDWEFEYTVIPNVEVTTNKVTSISAQSTDTQYPSAKATYTYIESTLGDIETLLSNI